MADLHDGIYRPVQHDITELARVMREERIARLRLFDGTEIALHESAFAPPEAAQQEAPAVPDCSCTHSTAEHNADGECLQGCDAATCAQKVTA